MGVYYNNQTTGNLELISGSTLFSDMPIGSIIPYGSNTLPSGSQFLLCNGQAVSRTIYKDLFDVIGTSFGSGDGSTTFNVPDLRESVPVGSGTRGNGVTDHDTYTMGQFKDDQKQTHTHTISHTHTRGTMEIAGNLTNYNKTNAASGYYNASGAFVHTGYKGSYASGPISSDDINVEGIDFIASRNWTGSTSEPSNANSGNDTGRTGTTTHGKQLGVNYIIKAKQSALPIDIQADVASEILSNTVDSVTNGDMNPVTSNAVYDALAVIDSPITKVGTAVNGDRFWSKRTGNVVEIMIDGTTGSNIPCGQSVVVAKVPKNALTISDVCIEIDSKSLVSAPESGHKRAWVDSIGNVCVFIVMPDLAATYTGNIYIGGTYITTE